MITLNQSKQKVSDDLLHIEQIVLEIQQGNIERYRTVISHYQKQIYFYCSYLLSDKGQAEDAVQEVFIKSYRDIQSYTYAVSFQAWLYKIAYHHCLNLNKKKARDRKLLQSFRDLYRPVQRHISGAEIQDFLYPLSMEERHILILRAVEEYSYDEIAEVMNLKSATVRKKYERLRKKMINFNQKGGYAHESKLHKARG